MQEELGEMGEWRGGRERREGAIHKGRLYQRREGEG